MSKIKFFSIFLLFCFCCGGIKKEYLKESYLGTIKDFQIMGTIGLFSTAIVIITTSQGNKVSVRYYKEIAIGDSVWSGCRGIIYGN
jgi:hypothetical protein